MGTPNRHDWSHHQKSFGREDEEKFGSLRRRLHLTTWHLHDYGISRDRYPMKNFCISDHWWWAMNWGKTCWTFFFLWVGLGIVKRFFWKGCWCCHGFSFWSSVLYDEVLPIASRSIQVLCLEENYGLIIVNSFQKRSSIPTSLCKNRVVERNCFGSTRYLQNRDGWNF